MILHKTEVDTVVNIYFAYAQHNKGPLHISIFQQPLYSQYKMPIKIH